jgi:resuscitation-promoting factor RpfA
VAVNDKRDKHRDDDIERDPRLARLLEAAGGEEPPPALDAAILAAARREVSARPQVVGGGASSATPAPVVRAKRHWYVPVSIAAVLVISMSLVTLVHEQKGDALTQPPRPANVPSSPPAAAPGAQAGAGEASRAAAPDQADAMLRDTIPAKPKLAEKTPGAAPRAVNPASEADAELAKKQRTDKTGSAADSAPAAPGGVRREQAASTAAQEPEAPAKAAVASPAPEPAATQAAPPPVPRGELKAPADPFPAQASRDAPEARQRNEADNNAARGAVAQAPVVPPAPPPAAAAAPARRAAPAAEMAAPQMAPAPVVAAKPMTAPPAARMAEKRGLPWRGLEDQPPEKWLERLAEFKRDGRVAEADEMMVEFRRRFPEHPASAR